MPSSHSDEYVIFNKKKYSGSRDKPQKPQCCVCEGAAGYLEDFCDRCAFAQDRERDRRIRFIRSVVGNIAGKGLYRDESVNIDQAWKVAKALAESDPYRDKRFDLYVSL